MINFSQEGGEIIQINKRKIRRKREGKCWRWISSRWNKIRRKYGIFIKNSERGGEGISNGSCHCGLTFSKFYIFRYGDKSVLRLL